MRLNSLLLLLVFAFVASAQAVDEKYVKDGSGRIVIDGSKRCVIDGSHSSDYTKVEACGDVVAVVRPPVVEVPRPPAPTWRRVEKSVSISAETLFAFGKANLSEGGKAELDRLASEINGYSRTNSISVVGHTDRIGSDAANQRLSERRANTVVSYLAAKGIDSGLMMATGRGETQPVVACDGLKGSALIACLQPNRRVEVSVSGEVIDFVSGY